MVLKFIIFLLIAYQLVLTEAYNSNPNHQWICNINDQCEKLLEDKSSEETNIDNKVKFDSQNICRLSCGRYGSVWPQPTIESLISHERIYFEPSNVRFNLATPTSATNQYLLEVSRLFVKNIKKECDPKCSYKNGKPIFVKVSVNTSNINLDWDTDEFYKLTVSATDRSSFVEIKAHSIYGARHGIETLSHLVAANKKSGLVMPSSVRILDKPKFKHRGLLLDTARNFIPLKNILSTIDGMATSKMNVFHWHATDTHSFPIEIKSVPELQRYGAYSSDCTYSRTEIQYVVQYARQRGVRTLIEIDGPSHSGNGWNFGPEANLGVLGFCINRQPWRKFCIQPPCGQLNPLNENVYMILSKVFTDLFELISPEETLHMGGDEVFIGCWNATREILNYLHKNGLSSKDEKSFYSLWSKFHEKNLNSWDAINSGQTKPVILWSSHLTDPDIIESYLPKERYIIQTWVPSNFTLNSDLIKKGYKIIISTKNAWYLDHGFWGTTTYYSWHDVYNNALNNNSTVLGGEVCMWTEHVDENSIDNRVWPRTGAAAERLWSDPETSSFEAEARFFEYRQRLVTRGLGPEAIVPKWCEINEGQCS